ncbi:sugar transferase [Tepidicaulis sp.]|uniref:sugar transferase n=1 Tax=Tepidicaulis sp. TaxID=1920809 RepID=UPI003B5CC874
MTAGYRFTKRAIDVASVLLLLPVLLVPMAGIAVLIRLSLGSPVFFRQLRAGKNGEPFKLVKFRTMLDAVDKDGEPLPDEKRLTQLGRFLRSSSLDELPELWNVFKGDMSLVGPRPLLVDYLPYYSPEQMRRHDVRPGLTGWAQVNGRNAVSWEERLRADAEYVKRASLLLDGLILIKTLKAVLSAEGISAEGHATMPRFDEEMRRKYGKQ